jgi:hypothetical protein
LSSREKLVSIVKARLKEEEYEQSHGRRYWTQRRSNKFSQLVGILKKVKIVPIEQLLVLLSSSGCRQQTTRPLGSHRPTQRRFRSATFSISPVIACGSPKTQPVRVTSRLPEHVREKPLRVEPSGLLRRNSFVKPKGSKKKKKQKYLTFGVTVS